MTKKRATKRPSTTPLAIDVDIPRRPIVAAPIVQARVECPECGCPDCPETDRAAVFGKRRVIVRRVCRHCGKAWRRVSPSS